MVGVMMVTLMAFWQMPHHSLTNATCLCGTSVVPLWVICGLWCVVCGARWVGCRWDEAGRGLGCPSTAVTHWPPLGEYHMSPIRITYDDAISFYFILFK